MRQRMLLGLSASSVLAGLAWAADPATVFVDQGPNWTQASRADFYSRDQGARMIPLTWLQALRQSNGEPFLADSLARYGYLPNPANNNGLPIGFTASGSAPGNRPLFRAHHPCHCSTLGAHAAHD